MNISSVARVLCPVLALVALEACGGSSSSNGSPKVCGSTSGTGSCTSAEVNAYQTCLSNACSAPYAACSTTCGNYQSCHNNCGCGDTACLLACPAPSDACQTCLTNASSCLASCTLPACYTSTGVGGKSGGAGGTSGVGGKSGTGGVTGVGGTTGTAKACADLQACCAGSANQAACTTTLNGLTPLTDSTCSVALPTFQALYCPPSGSNGTCADLLNCCNATTVAQYKTACMTAYSQLLSSGDAACGLELATLKSSFCP